MEQDQDQHQANEDRRGSCPSVDLPVQSSRARRPGCSLVGSSISYRSKRRHGYWVDIYVATLATLTTNQGYPTELVAKLNEHVLPSISSIAQTSLEGFRHESSTKPSHDALGDLDKLSWISHTA
jgi:hypothetical protein